MEEEEEEVLPYSSVLKNLDEKLFGLEPQIKKLNDLFAEFVRSGKGDSALVIGPASSGKSSVISKMITTFAGRCDVITVDGLTQANDSNALLDFEASIGLLNCRCVGILYNFDQFLLRGNQIFVYKLLNATRNEPLLVICVSERIDCRDLMEKRVRSRLSNITVCFGHPLITSEHFVAALKHFLHSDSDFHNRLVDKFLARKAVRQKCKWICEVHRSFAYLKNIAAVFLCSLESERIENIDSDEASSCFERSVDVVVPLEDPICTIISGLTLRQLCLLVCCIRLVKNNAMKRFPYITIVRSFRRFSRDYYSLLRVKREVVLYKDLDVLCELGLLEVPSSDAKSFSRVTSLQVDVELLMECVKEFKPLPQAVVYFLDDVHS